MKIRFFILICFSFGLFLLSGCGNDIYDEIGASCSHDRDCPAPGRCLTGSKYPGGFCTISCDYSGHCPGGTACIDKSDGVCLFECGSNRDCPDRWKCKKKELEEDDDYKVRVCIGK